MADFYNFLGSSNVLGTAGVDRFFLFNKDANPNNLRADATWQISYGIRRSIEAMAPSSSCSVLR